MLFRLPNGENLNKIKRMDRGFESFYLPSLKKFILKFEKVVLWCDQEVADFLRAEGLDKNILMRVMKFEELPHYKERDEWLGHLRHMKTLKNPGYFFKGGRTPEEIVDYLFLWEKPAIVKWAAENDKWNSRNFMWLDSGMLNPLYNRIWSKWDGGMYANPLRARFCLMEMNRGRRDQNLTPVENVIGAAPEDIAMINTPYEIGGGSFMIPKNMVGKFFDTYEKTREIMKKNRLVATEQGIFQTMIREGFLDLFELSYIKDYIGLINGIVKKDPDYISGK